jgi:hypothetical protein
MASEPPTANESVEMPRPTVAPVVLSLGLTLLALGLATRPAFAVVGVLILLAGLGLWVSHLLPGRGHLHEPLAGPDHRPRPVTPAPGTVEELRPGVPGYRFRLPERIHPISAGLEGGIVGGLVLPLPALLWCLLTRHSVWYPVNVLAGMVLPGLEEANLGNFNLALLVVGLCIHATVSVVIGLMYGVLLPTLPFIPRPLAWGGLLMPLLWTAVVYPVLAVINPVLSQRLDWPSFIFAQFLFGLAAALAVMRLGSLPPLRSGVLGGIIGGVLMPVPAFAWGLLTHHGIWFPVNVLAAMTMPGLAGLPPEELHRELEQFHGDWLAVAAGIHVCLSVGFGLVYGWLLPRLPVIPGPLAWGGLLMPLLWTGMSYGLMGVVNPTLDRRVDWPSFVAAQFVFGVAAAVVVIRSQTVPVPPAGTGPETR